ncbi:MAG: phosphatidylinositol mannoside acyltransferase [Ilumatobacteraceae bacterium]
MNEPNGRRPFLADALDVDRLTDRATVGAYRLGSLAARAMPALLAAGMSTPFGASAAFASPERRAMVARHQQRVDPTLRGLRLRQAVQESFDSYARYYIESFRLPNLSKRAVNATFRRKGYQYILDGLGAGNGVIVALPHLGGWEWAGRWFADRGHQISVVVERLDPPELFDWFAELRSRLGMNVIALGPDAGSEVLRALRNNHVVCLLSDRDLDGRGPEVEFFGEVTTLPAGPAALALRTGAPIIPVVTYFTDRVDGHYATAYPPLEVARTKGGRLRDDVQRVTQDIAHVLEDMIRRAPTQWHMFQPNWPSDPGYSNDRPSSPSR